MRLEKGRDKVQSIRASVKEVKGTNLVRVMWKREGCARMGQGTDSACLDLRNGSRGTESITEKLRERGSTKDDKGPRDRAGFFQTCIGTNGPYNGQSG